MKKNVVRVLALALVVLMCLSLLPLAAHAQDHVHSFVPMRVEPTCVLNGYVQLVCEICGADGGITEFIPPTNLHSFINVPDEEYMIQEGDCEHAFQYWKTCSVCGSSAEEAYGLALANLAEELNARRNSGEQADWEGIIRDAVVVFDERYKFSEGGEGHHYIEVEHQEATCTSDGWNDYSYCDVCGESFGFEAIPAKGHRWSEFTVTKAPTCTEDGSMERVCDVCDLVEVEAIPALGHTYGDFTVTKAATCTEDGSKERVCSVCGYKDIQVIPAAHKFGEFVVTEEPTCYAGGAQQHTCTVCGAVETEWLAPAHKFGEFTVTQEPTCYSTGAQERVCTVCGEKEVEWIPTVDHRYVDGVCVFCGEAAPEGYVVEANLTMSDVAALTGEEIPEPAEAVEETEEPEEEVSDTADVVSTFAAFAGEGVSADDYVVYDVEPAYVPEEGLSFDLPLPAGYIDGDTVEVYHFNGSTWETVTDVTLNADAGIVTVNYYKSFSPFAVLVRHAALEASDTATFALSDYTIKFDGNGADSGSVGDLTLSSEKAETLPKNTYERATYAFTGWNTEPDGFGSSFEDQQSVEASNFSSYPSNEITLYAQWDPIKIRFNNNGGTGTMSDQRITETATPLNANTFTRTGYDYAGWDTDKDGKGLHFADGAEVSTANISATTTLYAQWKKQISITYQGNSDAGSKSYFAEPTKYPGDTVTVKTLEETGIVAKPERVFVEWNTKADGTGTSYNPVEDKISLTESSPATITLYAQWGFDVTFDANGGEGTIAPISAVENKELKLPVNKKITRDNFYFDGWNTVKEPTDKNPGTAYSDGATIPASAMTGPITLYAQWKSEDITVTFDANGGTGTPMTQPGKIGESLKLNANTYEREGYEFAGWNTLKAPTAGNPGTAYNDKATVPGSAITDSFTLYAQWKENDYTITFDGNGATSGKMDPQDVELGKSVQLNANGFERENWSFNNWNTEKDGSGQSYANRAKLIPDGSMTLYAQWVKTSYSVNYDPNNGGGEMEADSFEKGEVGTVRDNEFDSPDNFSKTFGEWNTKADESGKSYLPGDEIESNDVPDDITLYAIWRDILEIWFYPGENASGSTTKVNEPEGSIVTLPTTDSLGFTRPANQLFAGWTLGNDDTLYQAGQQVIFGDTDGKDGDVVKTTARTVTANWADTVKISYHPNGGTVTTASGTKTDAATFSAPKNAPYTLYTKDQLHLTRTGYAFQGWGNMASTDPEHPTYKDGETVQDGFPRDTTIYALWVKHAFTGKVTITGNYSYSSDTAYVGETLTANVTGESYFTEFDYQWYRDDEALEGETDVTYTPITDDFGHNLYCKVTATEADEGEDTLESNIKTVGIDTSDKRIVNNGQTEAAYVLGVQDGMTYSVNNGEKYTISGSYGAFPVTQNGVYRFYTADGKQVGEVNVVNWYTIGYNISTGSSSDSSSTGSGTVTMRRGTSTLTSVTVRDSDSNPIIESYSLTGYSNVWIVREDANVADITMTVHPASGSYGHVSLNNGGYSSSGSDQVITLGRINEYKLYDVVFNRSSSSPKTGDMSNLGLWSALCFASFVGVTGILTQVRRKKSRG